MGKPKVGGPFQLVDQDGNVFSSDDMLGKYSLVCNQLTSYDECDG
jgi:protein SCO1/2